MNLETSPQKYGTARDVGECELELAKIAKLLADE
jgi:hypothetical protein